MSVKPKNSCGYSSFRLNPDLEIKPYFTAFNEVLFTCSTSSLIRLSVNGLEVNLTS